MQRAVPGLPLLLGERRAGARASALLQDHTRSGGTFARRLCQPVHRVRRGPADAVCGALAAPACGASHRTGRKPRQCMRRSGLRIRGRFQSGLQEIRRHTPRRLAQATPSGDLTWRYRIGIDSRARRGEAVRGRHQGGRRIRHYISRDTNGSGHADLYGATLFPLLVNAPGKRMVRLTEGTHSIVVEKPAWNHSGRSKRSSTRQTAHRYRCQSAFNFDPDRRPMLTPLFGGVWW